MTIISTGVTMHTLRLHFFLATFLCLSTVYAHSSDGIRSSIQVLVDGMCKDNQLKDAAVGIAGVRTAQWERFEKLSKEATDNELRELTSHTNGVVCCYAFIALAERKHEAVFPILVKHLHDSREIKTQSGCIVWTATVGEFFFDVVTLRGYTIVPRLTAEQYATLDSMLLFDSTLNSQMLDNRLPDMLPYSNPIFYSQLRTLVQQGEARAIIALARYRQQEDLERIVQYLGDWPELSIALQAVEQFPDASFFSRLQAVYAMTRSCQSKYSSGYTMEYLCRAIVQYKTPDARQLLEDILADADSSTSAREYNKAVWFALALYPDAVFSGLQERIEIEDYDKEYFQYRINEEFGR